MPYLFNIWMWNYALLAGVFRSSIVFCFVPFAIDQWTENTSNMNNYF